MVFAPHEWGDFNDHNNRFNPAGKSQDTNFGREKHLLIKHKPTSN